MTMHIDEARIAGTAEMPAVREAAARGARLIALWPLTDARQLDNDAKYAENLQVRMTLMMARVLTGEDVTIPDAEFVYEGADAIPGRPQSIVDALLAANDAYDTMAEYRTTGDTGVLFEAAERLGTQWNEDTADTVSDLLDGIVPSSGDTGGDTDGDTGDSDAAATALALRFARALAVCDRLFVVIGERQGHDPAATLPVLLFVNELRDRMSVPRICLTDGQYRELLEARTAEPEDTLDATVRVIAPIAAEEWARHYDEVNWDPDEAKRLAKEEDERKNKEALAAKFAHVKDDPSKPAVEL